MSKHTGEVIVDIGDKQMTLVYDWRALAEIKERLGTDGQVNAMNGDINALADLAAIGLMRHHKDVSASDIIDASPPVMPLVAIIDKALSASYFGPGGPPEENPQNPQTGIMTRLRMAWRLLIGRE